MAVKPSMDLIVALGKKPTKGAPAPSAPDEPAEPKGPPPGLDQAMQELIDSINSGDSKGAADAFSSAWDICSSSE